MSGRAAKDHHGQADVLRYRREIVAKALSQKSRRHLSAGARCQGRSSVAEAVRAIGGPCRHMDILKVGPAGRQSLQRGEQGRGLG